MQFGRTPPKLVPPTSSSAAPVQRPDGTLETTGVRPMAATCGPRARRRARPEAGLTLPAPVFGVRIRQGEDVSRAVGGAVAAAALCICAHSRFGRRSSSWRGRRPSHISVESHRSSRHSLGGESDRMMAELIQNMQYNDRVPANAMPDADSFVCLSPPRSLLVASPWPTHTPGVGQSPVNRQTVPTYIISSTTPVPASDASRPPSRTHVRGDSPVPAPDRPATSGLPVEPEMTAADVCALWLCRQPAPPPPRPPHGPPQEFRRCQPPKRSKRPLGNPRTLRLLFVGSEAAPRRGRLKGRVFRSWTQRRDYLAAVAELKDKERPPRRADGALQQPLSPSAVSVQSAESPAASPSPRSQLSPRPPSSEDGRPLTAEELEHIGETARRQVRNFKTTRKQLQAWTRAAHQHERRVPMRAALGPALRRLQANLDPLTVAESMPDGMSATVGRLVRADKYYTPPKEREDVGAGALAQRILRTTEDVNKALLGGAVGRKAVESIAVRPPNEALAAALKGQLRERVSAATASQNMKFAVRELLKP
eukprot:TRINITY_DN6012_c1_g1_i2.p1 TRINITY_DN6012_c1_g1~~TRINITY_DN6012_c1_g1_i2.p1  ORF type:complete len:537 (+),score=172.62 TRINITY_DN6012_c1_g1_i2:65-1675(+)